MNRDAFHSYLLQRLEQYAKKEKKLGLEFEFFLCNPLDPVETAQKLVTAVDCSAEQATLSIEPAGQIELSFAPQDSIGTLRDLLNRAVDKIYRFLPPDISLHGVGYHPFRGIETLPLLDKPRYRHMYDYFLSSEETALGIYMMKGTASIQVSVDFASLGDLEDKLFLFNHFSDSLYDLFDSAYRFEHEDAHASVRKFLWSGIRDGRTRNLTAHASECADGEPYPLLSRYIQHLSAIDPIIWFREPCACSSCMESPAEVCHADIPTSALPRRKVSELLKDVEERHLPIPVDHIMSMVFPDTRIKQYLELRMPDSLGKEFALLPAVVLGYLAYSPSLMQKYLRMAKEGTSEEDIPLRIVEDVILQIETDDFLDAAGELDALKKLKFILLNYGSIREYYREHPVETVYPKNQSGK